MSNKSIKLKNVDTSEIVEFASNERNEIVLPAGNFTSADDKPIQIPDGITLIAGRNGKNFNFDSPILEEEDVRK